MHSSTSAPYKGKGAISSQTAFMKALLGNLFHSSDAD
ncbi:Chromosome segregation ATPase [Giardia duodenalis]|uniref:Chromosome segregation ATPase n=1 Tax=Giardia intestinalis TaxID=5741 RepID=V6TNB4_GIAIN|nr:Chromosome segregation ATPase [Giardia intestinalis]